MGNNINDFLIVRKANSMELVKPYNKLFLIDNKMYHGIERASYYDMYEDYFNNKLPLEINNLLKNIIDVNNNMVKPFIKNIGDAKMLLNYCKKKNDYNEIIGLQFSEEACDTNIEIEGYMIKWLGFDVISVWNNSLLFLGLFSKPEYFEGWIGKVNNYGLFSDFSFIQKYIDEYLILANKGVVEDHISPESGFQVVRIALLSEIR